MNDERPKFTKSNRKASYCRRPVAKCIRTNFSSIFWSTNAPEMFLYMREYKYRYYYNKCNVIIKFIFHKTIKRTKIKKEEKKLQNDDK